MDIWFISDGRAGHLSQLTAIAKIFQEKGYRCIILNLKFSASANLPNFLKPSLLTGITNRKSIIDKIKKPKGKNIDKNAKPKALPNIVIGCGRKTAPVVCFIKKYIQKKYKDNHKIISAQIMDPHFRNDYFDKLFIPEHDKPSKKKKNIYPIVTAPNKVTEESLTEGVEKYRSVFEPYLDNQNAKISVIIGGDSRKKKFFASYASKLVKNINNLQKDLQANIFITNSPRSSDKLTKYLAKNLKSYDFFHDCHNDKKSNPYMAMLGMADIIIVTADSVSMVSEAINAKKLVFVYDDRRIMTGKTKAFLKDLYKYGHAYSFTQNYKKIKKACLSYKKDILKPVPVENSAFAIAESILAKYNGYDESTLNKDIDL